MSLDDLFTDSNAGCGMVIAGLVILRLVLSKFVGHPIWDILFVIAFFALIAMLAVMLVVAAVAFIGKISKLWDVFSVLLKIFFGVLAFFGFVLLFKFTFWDCA